MQGTGLPQLALGPGHVPGTALPGQVGNFAVAAHRVTAGNPFLHLNELRPGDKVMVITAATRYTYLVTHTELVLPGDTAVLDPVPGHPHQPPREAMITLITCDPPWTGTHRIIVSGSLDAQTPRHQRVSQLVEHERDEEQQGAGHRGDVRDRVCGVQGVAERPREDEDEEEEDDEPADVNADADPEDPS